MIPLKLCSAECTSSTACPSNTSFLNETIGTSLLGEGVGLLEGIVVGQVVVGLFVVCVVADGDIDCQEPIFNTYGLKYLTYSSIGTDVLFLLLLLLLVTLDKQLPIQFNVCNS